MFDEQLGHAATVSASCVAHCPAELSASDHSWAFLRRAKVVLVELSPVLSREHDTAKQHDRNADEQQGTSEQESNLLQH
jgi:hypothetical protein